MQEKHIFKEREYNLPVAEMWLKWTTSNGLRSFFGADNKMELKVGASFEIYFMLDAPEGSRGSEGCKVLSFLPEKMFSFSWNAPPHLKEIRSSTHQTCVVILFEKTGATKTKISLYHHDWKTGGEWDECFDYFDKAWDVVLDWLEKSIG